MNICLEFYFAVQRNLCRQDFRFEFSRNLRSGKLVSNLDTAEHLNRCLIASIVFPDLSSKELCNAYGTEDPVSLPSKMFLVDEYEKLARAFAELNGLKTDDGEVDLSGDITKN